MLPPKIGDGVFGSSSGGVNPAGASGSLVVAGASSAMARMGRWATAETLPLVGLRAENCARDCFHGAATRSPEFGAESVGVKREACVAMAMSVGGDRICVGFGDLNEYLMRKFGEVFCVEWR